MKLTIRKSENLSDWWIIERAEHDGRSWLEKTDYGSRLMLASRFSDADVEGDTSEMLKIAEAIEKRSRASFKRCAVRNEGGRWFFSSPRNSTTEGECSIEEADDLARAIRVTVPAAVTS